MTAGPFAVRRTKDIPDKPVLLPKLGNRQAEKKADEIRAQVVNVSVRNEAGHIAPSLSCIDILVTLYYRVMNLARNPEWENRDRLVFSKAHGCYGMYAILSDIGFLDKLYWDTFYRGSPLCGCVERNPSHGIEASCGSLGHGLPLAVGIAFGAKLQKRTYRVYCVVGDGEMQEGSNWEAIQFAVRHRLSNLTLIVDCNRLQAMDSVRNVLGRTETGNELADKLSAFGMETGACDGHSMRDLSSAIQGWVSSQKALQSPQALIAHTTKGYGLRCMENVAKFHFRLPTNEELKMGNRYEQRRK